MATEKRTIMIEVEVGKNQSLENLDEKLGEIGLRLKNIRNQSDKTSNSMKAGFTGAASTAALIPGPIGMAATAMTGLTGATSTFVGALKTVKGALIATGVGAFVVIVGTLIAYFTETEKGAQKLRTIMAGLGAVVRTVADAMMSLDFRSLTTDLKENTQAAIANAKALNAVEEAEGELTIKRAEANRAITEARLLADDLTKSTAERIHQVYLAGVIEKRVADEELEIQRKRVAAMESNLRSKKDASEEERDLLEAAQVRLIELQNDTLKREKRLGSEVQSLKNEQAAKDKEADAARLEAVKERDAAEVEAAKKKAAEIEEALKAQYANELRLAQEAADGKLRSDEYFAERRAKTAEQQLELEIERALRAEDEKFNAVMEALFAQDATKEEYIEAQRLYEQEQMAIENDLRYAFDQEKLAQAKTVADEEARINKEKNDKIKAQERELREAKVGAARATAGALGQISALIEQQEGEATAASKAFAVAQVLIDTATSISSAIAGATQAAAAGGPAAPFLLVTYIATMVGSVVGAIASATSILDSVPGGGSASGAVAGVASATSAPSVQPVTTNTTQLNNTQQAELMPVQAYVVETAITGSQGNVTQIESQATFGGG
jgi:hypothetical protein